MPQFLLLKKVKQDNLTNEPIANSHVSIYYKNKNKSIVKILVIGKIQYIFVKKDYIQVNLSLIKSGVASKGEQDLPLYVREYRECT